MPVTVTDWRLASRNDIVHGLLPRRPADAAVSQSGKIEAGEQRLSGTEQARGHRDVQLVDQAGLEILPDGGGAPEQSNVLLAGRGSCAVERRTYSVGHEVEDGAALHLLWRARMVREHESRCVVRRILSPPSAPRFVGPWTADRTEHVATEDECADVRHPTLGEIIVDA